jgi:hypothetical protein
MASIIMFCLILWIISFVCADVLTLHDLQIMNAMTRQGDDAMIRLEPTRASAMRQKTVCRRMLTTLVETLEKANGLSVRSEAAEVIRLCTTSNPKNRVDFGLENSGTICTGLKEVIHDGLKVYNATGGSTQSDEIEALQSISKGAEAIWILTYNSDENQEHFFKIIPWFQFFGSVILKTLRVGNDILIRAKLLCGVWLLFRIWLQLTAIRILGTANGNVMMTVSWSCLEQNRKVWLVSMFVKR